MLFYVLSGVLIVAGVFSIAYSIWKFVKKVRSESQDESQNKTHDDYGFGFIGVVSYLVDGICLLAGGIAILIKFG